MATNLPDNVTTNAYGFLLDPLSVIIKLAIVRNKPVGTKICIQNNIIYLQEPGPFQAVCRYIFNSNKTDLQFMYNPIFIACRTYLSPETVTSTPRIKMLFSCALDGLKCLIETYKSCTIIQLCLNYYHAIIHNALGSAPIACESIFTRDAMTNMYTEDTVEKLNRQWTPEKIKIVLNLIDFLVNDDLAQSNVRSMETIMSNIDKETHAIISRV